MATLYIRMATRDAKDLIFDGDVYKGALYTSIFIRDIDLGDAVEESVSLSGSIENYYAEVLGDAHLSPYKVLFIDSSMHSHGEVAANKHLFHYYVENQEQN